MSSWGRQDVPLETRCPVRLHGGFKPEKRASVRVGVALPILTLNPSQLERPDLDLPGV